MRTIESAHVQSALTLGMPAERDISRQIIAAIGKVIVADLKQAGFKGNRIEPSQLLLMVSLPVREMIARYMGNTPLSVEAWDLLGDILAQEGNINLCSGKRPRAQRQAAEFYSSALQASNLAAPLFIDDDLFAQHQEVKHRLETLDGSILPIIMDAGQGKRQGLLSLVCGSKGRIMLFGQPLGVLAARSLGLLLRHSMPSVGWCAVLPCDALFVPGRADCERVAKQLINGPEAFVFTRSPDELAFFGENLSTGQLLQKLAVKGFLSARAKGLEKVCRGLVKAGLVFHRRFAFQHTGGDQLPSARLMTPPMLCSILDAYNELAQDGRPFWQRRPVGGEFFWYSRITSALRTSLDEWRLLWEPSTGLTPADWDWAWHKENRFRPQTRGIYYPGLWMNLNSPAAVHAFYRNAANSSAPVIQGRLRALVGVEPDECQINSTLMGDIELTGDCLFCRSRVHVPQGYKLVVGKRVVIDRSLIEIEGKPESTTLYIPDDTVIVDSHIRGRLRGAGRDDLVYRVFTDDGLNFYGATVQATLFSRDRGRTLNRHALDYQPASNGLKSIDRRDIDDEKMTQALDTLLQLL